ncbi:MAG: MFS transporter [Gammaproteobacteria bacterium]|nr:MAG: MFS transporter [Gammaproteobacteria bacterium]
MDKKNILYQIDKKSMALFLSNFLSNLSFFSMLSILALYFTQSCRFSLQFSGLFMLFVLFISRTGRIILLPFFEKYTSKSALLISALLMGIGYFILSITKIKIFMFLAFLSVGVGYGCNSVYVRSLIGAGNNPSKLSYVKLSVVTNLSAAIGSLIAVYIFTHFSGDYVFLYSAILMLISISTTCALLQDERDHLSNINMLQAIRFIFRSPNILRMFGLTTLSWIIYVQIFSALPLFINNKLNDTKFLGSLYATNTILIVLFSVPLNKFLLRFNIHAYNFIITGYIFIGIGFLLLYLLPNLAMSYSSMIMWTFGEILIVPSLNSALSELIQGPERLHVFAFNGVAMGIGEGIGMYLGTALVGLQPISEVSYIYLYLSFIVLFFLTIAFMLKKQHFIQPKPQEI